MDPIGPHPTSALDPPAEGAGPLEPQFAMGSVRDLQLDLRRCLAATSAGGGLHSCLARIGSHLAAVYVGYQADNGGGNQTGDWTWEGFASIDGLRRSLDGSLAEAVATGRPGWVRLGGETDPVLLVAPVVGSDGQVCGAACAVVGACPPSSAKQRLMEFEGVIGYLSLLIATRQPEGPVAAQFSLADPGGSHGDDPLFLAYTMVADLRNRHRLDQVLLGFVGRGRVKVAAVCGLDQVRASNPGAKLVAAAMEECLDRGDPVSHPGEAETLHLHQEWSQSVGGGAVASFPLRHGEDIVAVVSVCPEPGRALGIDELRTLQAEMQSFAWLLPVSRLANRGLAAHACQAIAGGLRRVLGPDRWRSRLATLFFAGFLAWILFGTMPYSFTVPCTVIPASPVAVACPRQGILAEVLVRPGDPVREGELLARIETEDERLESAVLVAEQRRLDARIDQARAEGNPSEVKIQTAQRDSVTARLRAVERRIVASNIRAPRPGRVLEGDLERLVGSRLALGDPLFLLAHEERVQVEVRIPESRVWQARECLAATFAPTARPSERIVLDGLRIHPSANAAGGANLFLGRSDPLAAPDHLTPGMEGVVYLEVGDRSVWWILSHHITDWARLRFWF